MILLRWMKFHLLLYVMVLVYTYSVLRGTHNDPPMVVDEPRFILLQFTDLNGWYDCDHWRELADQAEMHGGGSIIFVGCSTVDARYCKHIVGAWFLSRFNIPIIFVDNDVVVHCNETEWRSLDLLDELCSAHLNIAHRFDNEQFHSPAIVRDREHSINTGIFCLRPPLPFEFGRMLESIGYCCAHMVVPSPPECVDVEDGGTLPLCRTDQFCIAPFYRKLWSSSSSSNFSVNLIDESKYGHPNSSILRHFWGPQKYDLKFSKQTRKLLFHSSQMKYANERICGEKIQIQIHEESNEELIMSDISVLREISDSISVFDENFVSKKCLSAIASSSKSKINIL